MNELPKGIRLLTEGYSDTPKPEVVRDEMDRGPANQELLNTRMRMEMQVTFFMDTRAKLEAFEDWYRNTIRIIDWFDTVHPRTGVAIRARFPNGERGPAVALVPGFRASSVNATVEYYEDVY